MTRLIIDGNDVDDGSTALLAGNTLTVGTTTAATNVPEINHAGGGGAATLNHVKAVADTVDAVIAALVAANLMDAP